MEDDAQVFNHGMEEGKPEEPREEGKPKEPLEEEEEEEAIIARTRRKPKEPSLEERRVHHSSVDAFALSELVRGVC